jgi:sulfur carrier protein ThiS
MRVMVKLLDMPKLFPSFESDKEIQIDFTGYTIKDLLHHLSIKLEPGKKDTFINNQGKVTPELSVFINGRSISDSNEFNQKLSEGDFIELVLAVG